MLSACLPIMLGVCEYVCVRESVCIHVPDGLTAVLESRWRIVSGCQGSSGIR